MVDLADAARAGAPGVRRELQRAGFHASEVGGADVPGCKEPLQPRHPGFSCICLSCVSMHMTCLRSLSGRARCQKEHVRCI